MNIENYLYQLVDDIGEILEQDAPRDGNAIIVDPEEQPETFRDHALNQRGIWVWEYSRITKEQLPEPKLFTEAQRSLLTTSLLSLLYHCGTYPDFPGAMPDAEKYSFLREYWQLFRAPLMQCEIHHHFCDFDPGNCPFPEYCDDCDSER